MGFGSRRGAVFWRKVKYFRYIIELDGNVLIRQSVIQDWERVTLFKNELGRIGMGDLW